jgi:tetratricopeptide (TPR) repeat protein
MIRKLSALSIMLCLTLSIAAQLTTPADGGNKKASVSEQIGITDITIHYDRPAVKGREGKIWNDLVHVGYKDLGFGTSKAAPWRAGANENTTITFSTDVKIEGQPLKAGKYGLFAAMGQGDATLIFSNNSSSWGSYYYDPKEDALKVTVKTKMLKESVERLKYEFFNETDNSATISLMWEKLEIPFKVEVDFIKTQMESFRNELRSNRGFRSDAWQQAAQFAVDNNTNLEEALLWSDNSLNGVFIGEKNFRNYTTKAAVLNKLGKSGEADATMKTAMPLANMQELHQYGRQLMQQKRNKEALEIFKMNAQKNPNNFTTYMGLARGYSAIDDYKNALKNAQLAQPLAPNQANKDAVEKMIAILKEGKDINQ